MSLPFILRLLSLCHQIKRFFSVPFAVHFFLFTFSCFQENKWVSKVVPFFLKTIEQKQQQKFEIRRKSKSATTALYTAHHFQLECDLREHLLLWNTFCKNKMCQWLEPSCDGRQINWNSNSNQWHKQRYWNRIDFWNVKISDFHMDKIDMLLLPPPSPLSSLLLLLLPLPQQQHEQTIAEIKTYQMESDRKIMIIDAGVWLRIYFVYAMFSYWLTDNPIVAVVVSCSL